MDATPRIGFEQLPDELRTALRPRVERLGYLGEFFQVAAHQPEALHAFNDFTEALKRALDWRLVETIALTIASLTDNAYERVQHEHLALKLGMSEPEVRALVAGTADRERFSDAELGAARLAREVAHARGGACTEAYASLEALVGPAVAVGCLMTATRYLAHATMSNTWGLRAPRSSPLREERRAHV